MCNTCAIRMYYRCMNNNNNNNNNNAFIMRHISTQTSVIRAPYIMSMIDTFVRIITYTLYYYQYYTV